MQFDELYKKVLNEYIVEEGLFDVAKGVAGAVAKDIAPKATAGVSTLLDQFKKGPDGKVKLEKPVEVKKDMEPEEVKTIIDNLANLENEVEEDLGYPIVYKGETLYYLAHDDQNLTVTAANGQTRKIPLEGLELDIVPMDQEEDAEGNFYTEGLWANINAKKKRGGKSARKGSKAYKAAKKAGDKLNRSKHSDEEFPSEDAESSPGRVKRAGASCKGSVAELRRMAKKYGGEKGKMYHWCANMKGGKRKSESEESKKKRLTDRVADKISNTLDIGKDWKDGSVIKAKPLVGVVRRGAKIANRVGAEVVKSGIDIAKAAVKGATEGGAYKRESRKSLKKRLAKLEAESEENPEEDAEKKKKVSKTRAKCQAKAKRKYDVWPSAYASGYVQKCVNRGGNIK